MRVCVLVVVLLLAAATAAAAEKSMLVPKGLMVIGPSRSASVEVPNSSVPAELRFAFERIPQSPWKIVFQLPNEEIVVTDQTLKKYVIYGTTIGLYTARAGTVSITATENSPTVTYESLVHHIEGRPLFKQDGPLVRMDAGFRADGGNATLILRSKAIVLLTYASPRVATTPCTGAQIAPGLILTNRHCFIDGSEVSSRDGKIQVMFGQFVSSLKDHEQPVDGTLVAHGSGEPSMIGMYPEDYAVVQLSSVPAGYTDAIAKLDPNTNTLKDGSLLDLITVWGYDAPFGKAVSNGPRCKVYDLHQTGADCGTASFKHYCESEEGTSGSPLINRSTGALVGLHFFGIARQLGNCAMSSQVLYRTLKQHATTDARLQPIFNP